MVLESQFYCLLQGKYRRKLLALNGNAQLQENPNHQADPIRRTVSQTHNDLAILTQILYQKLKERVFYLPMSKLASNRAENNQKLERLTEGKCLTRQQSPLHKRALPTRVRIRLQYFADRMLKHFRYILSVASIGDGSWFRITTVVSNCFDLRKGWTPPKKLIQNNPPKALRFG